MLYRRSKMCLGVALLPLFVLPPTLPMNSISAERATLEPAVGVLEDGVQTHPDGRVPVVTDAPGPIRP